MNRDETLLHRIIVYASTVVPAIVITFDERRGEWWEKFVASGSERIDEEEASETMKEFKLKEIIRGFFCQDPNHKMRDLK